MWSEYYMYVCMYVLRCGCGQNTVCVYVVSVMYVFVIVGCYN